MCLAVLSLWLLIGSSEAGTSCVFPFIYKGQTYQGCINLDHHEYWCSKTANYDVDKQFETCAGQPTGTKCSFPFQYQGKTYNECVSLGHATAWCASYPIYNGIYKNCDAADLSRGGVVGGGSVGNDTETAGGCVFPFQYKGTSYNACTTAGSSTPWCSKSAVYNGAYRYCNEPDPSLKCVSPFTYEGKQYTVCAKSANGNFWCSPTKIYRGLHRQCTQDEIKATEDSGVCVFPFTYGGQTYASCTKRDSTKFWCSKNAVYTGNFKYCASVDGVWSAWSQFDNCSASCGNGTQSRTRACNDPAPQNGGKACSGKPSETQSCNLGKCPVDGVWGTWSQFANCSAACGDGIQTRTRACNDPATQNGGKECSGNANETQSCNLGTCPVDGAWGAWTSFTRCSAECGPGTSTRSRKCDEPVPADGGKECLGNSSESRVCQGKCTKVKINGGWSEWSSFKPCSVACGAATQTRTRTCTNPAPENGGAECVGASSNTVACKPAGCNGLKDVLVSRKRPCTESSRHTTTTCALTVDDNLSTSHPHCLHTGANDPAPWVQIDLGKSMCLTRVEMITRQDCCPERLQNFKVFVKPDNASAETNEIMCYHYPGKATPKHVFKFSCTKCGRYLRVVNGIGPLQLCDLKAYARPTEVVVTGGQPCTESSRHTTTTCKLTVDNNLATSHPQCLHTGANDPAPWVQIDLGTPLCLTRVEMITRQDCCPERLQNFKVFVKSDGASAGTNETMCYHYPGKAKAKQVFKFACTKCGRYLRVVNGIGPLQLCDLKAYMPVAAPAEALVSSYKPCTESSRHTTTTCALTVDDSLSTSHPNCLHTGANDPAPWVQIDLGKSMCITRVEMITRQDCCPERLRNFRVFVKADSASAGTNETMCYHYPGQAKPKEVFKFACTKCGRYLRVVNGMGPLQLCDLKAYAKTVKVDGGWGTWSQYASCSVTCGGNGTQTRTRACVKPVAEYGGKACAGLRSETQRCNLGKCPVNGGWSEWSQFAPCSVACTGVTRTRTRTCTHPAPAHGGAECVGNSSNTGTCDPSGCRGMKDVLVSRKRPCTESSRHTTTTCALTVDDNLSTSHPHCLHTGANDPAPWVQIDLGKSMCLTRVEMITRQDCCPERLQNFKVYVKPDSASAGTNEMMCYHYPGKAKPNQAFKFGCTKCGRYLRVVNGIGPLQLCDLKAYARATEVVVTGGQPCTESSRHTTTTCKLTVDNNLATSHPQCLHTGANDPAPWVQIDLGTPLCLTRVEMITRQDCCPERLQNFKVFVKSDSASAGTNETMCYHYPGKAKPKEVFKFACTKCGRYLRVVNGIGPLQLCDLKAYMPVGAPTEALVSSYKPCTESSRHTTTTCALTVDDNLSTSHPNCLHTGANDPAPWVQIDLGKSMCLTRVEMITRQDCCTERLRNFKVFVKTHSASAGTNETMCFHYPGQAKPKEVFKFACTKCGRYLRVVNGMGPLQLCDLKAYAKTVKVDGGWGTWSQYASCSVTCGGNGTQTRTRACDTPVAEYGGKACAGLRSEIQRCNLGKCPVNGGWSEWSQFAPCSVACTGVTRTRTRTCTHPAPAHGGAECVGNSSNTGTCDPAGCKGMKDVLVSRKRPCTESSRHAPTTCALTVDDNLSTSHPHCLHTANDPAPWVQIDLGKSMCLTRVEMITRQDCCPERLQNFKVYVKPDSASAGTNETMCYHYPGKAKPNQAFKFGCTKCGRYLRVVNGIGPLQLCDLKAYARATEVVVTGGQPCTESSRHTTTTCKLTVDNNLATSHPQCLHTGANDPAPWVQIDLGTPLCLTRVEMITRQDCCPERLQNFKVFVKSDSASAGTNETMCYHFPGKAKPKEVFKFACTKCGRYLRVVNGIGPLQLCDLKAYMPVGDGS